MLEVENAALNETMARGLKSNRRAVRALVIPLDRGKILPISKQVEDKTGQSKELPEDPWDVLAREGDIVEPPFDLLTLSLLPEHSTEMGQCIEAMVSNIDGFGYRFVPRLKSLNPGQVDTKLVEAVKQENVDLQNFFAYACIDDSFTSFRKKLRKDLETTGNAWAEVIRGINGKIQTFNHLPAYQMRLGVMDADPIKVPMQVLELQHDSSIQIKTIQVWRRFRKHAQSKATYFRNMAVVQDYTMRWFKEFGDPRVYDKTAGTRADTDEEKGRLKEEDRANEAIHFRLYSPRSPYGLPRYIGNLLSILGDRAAEEINYITFRNNNIPSMALLVSNGQLTDATIKRIESFVESQIQGSDNYSKFLIIEGESDTMEGEDSGHVKLDIKPLVKEQHIDELFQHYSKNNQDKIRRAFRLPPIFVGRSDDYTRATAESSRRLADEQVFAPERDDFDDWVNRVLFPAMGIQYHRFKSNSPNTTDNTELVKILAGAEKTGGMTPRIARLLLQDILSMELPDFPGDFPADVPFSMTMAEAVKNKADATEPGQQLTALKAMEALTGADSGYFALLNESFVDKLVEVQRRLENGWREAVEQEVADHEHGSEKELDEL